MSRKEVEQADRERIRALLRQPEWQQATVREIVRHLERQHIKGGRSLVGRVIREMVASGERQQQPYQRGVGGHMPHARTWGGFRFGPNGSPIRTEEETDG